MKNQALSFAIVLVATALFVPFSPGAVVDPSKPQGNPSINSPANLVAGEQGYARCMGCHSPERNRTGPRHCGLIGRVSGTLPGFDYTDAMKAANILWSAETLDTFLKSPTTAVPGTAMGFAGVTDPTERRNLIAWLATLSKNSPLCSPSQSIPETN